MSEEKKEVLLEVKHLKKYFNVETNFFGKPTAVLKAVDDVSFKIYKGHHRQNAGGSVQTNRR